MPLNAININNTNSSAIQTRVTIHLSPLTSLGLEGYNYAQDSYVGFYISECSNHCKAIVKTGLVTQISYYLLYFILHGLQALWTGINGLSQWYI